MIRDSMDVHDSNAIEVAPLIPDPPLKRKRKARQGALHRCWNIFSYCSRWTCIFITLAIVVLIIILCKSLLPFGWPSWIPSLSYDSTDPHIILIVTDDLGWNDVGYSQYLAQQGTSSSHKTFTDFEEILELERQSKTSSNTQPKQSTSSQKNHKKNHKSHRRLSESNSDSDRNEKVEELFADGQTFQTLSFDTLAQEGIILNRFYVSQEGASTRASILTGRHGYRMGLQSGIDTGSGAHIPTSMKTLSEHLSEKRNYITHLIGKWNLGYSKWSYTPTERGFDTFLGFHQKWLDYWHYTSSDERTYENRVGWDLWKNEKVYDLSVEDRIFSTELFTAEAVSLIQEHATGSDPDRPMFMMFSAPNPRTPLDYHVKFSDNCALMEDTIREKYCNVVQSLDHTVGSIVNELKAQNMYERSLIIIASDNGGLICYDIGDSEKCSGASNYPLRAGKGTLFEGGIRTRALIAGGMVPTNRQGAVYSQPLFHVDLFSTILGAAQIDLTDDENSNQLDGINHYNYFISEDDDFEHREGGVLELVMDDDANLVRGVFMAYPYKYIIQVDEAYDGWYVSPFDGGKEIPTSAQGSSGLYESPRAGKVTVVDDFEEYLDILQSRLSTAKSTTKIQKFAVVDDMLSNGVSSSNSLQFGSDESNTEDNEVRTLTYNEYLFDIESDEGERNNLADTHGVVMTNLREKLLEIFGNMEYRMPQDSTSSDSSNPSLLGNVWWPFEEKYKK